LSRSPGGGWIAQVWLEAGRPYRELVAEVHRTLVVDLVPHQDAPDDEEPRMRGEVFGHTLLVHIRNGAVHLALAPSGHGLPGAPLRDVSAALATLFVGSAAGAWRVRACGVPDPANPLHAAPVRPGDPMGWGGTRAHSPDWPPRCGLGFDLEMETPPSHLTRDVGTSGVRPREGDAWYQPLPTRYGQRLRLPWIVSDLGLYLRVWFADTPDAEGDTPTYVATHLGMHLRLDLGTPERPVHRLRATPVAGAEVPILDVSDVAAALVYEVGGGMPAASGRAGPYAWTVRARRSSV
jgi:hypothetical protein